MDVLDLSSQRPTRPVCLLIGNYDGVHLGHRAIIDRARSLAAREGLETAVLSFRPHPLKVLDPQRAPLLLQTPAQKQALLDHYGIDHYLIQPFNDALSSQDPETFVRELKVRVDFRFLLVGFNFRFGFRRAGDVATLQRLAAKYEYRIEAMPAQIAGGAVISSSRIRALVREGRLLEAAELLGRPYFLRGAVTRGAQLGRKLDAPTANLTVENELLPKYGVYAAWAHTAAGWRRAIANIGTAPTVDDQGPRIETHLFEFDGSLYDQRLTLCLGAFLRAEVKFDSLDALRRQIQIDMQRRLALPDRDPPDLMLA